MVRFKINNNVQFGVALVSGLSLFSLYLFFASYSVRSIVSAPMVAVEATIFYTMILRVLGLLFVPFLRRLHPQIKIVILSLEAFVLFLLILFVLLTRVSSYGQLMSEVLTSWLGATLLIVTPYAIYELALIMYRGTDLTTLAVSSAPLVAICLFLSNFVTRVPNPIYGLSNFGTEMISSLRAQPGLAGSPLGANLFVSGASVLFFLSMIVYITYRLNQSAKPLAFLPKYHYALALMLVGCLVLYLWLLLSSYFHDTNVFEILSVPAVMIPIILWVVARG